MRGGSALLLPSEVFCTLSSSLLPCLLLPRLGRSLIIRLANRSRQAAASPLPNHLRPRFRSSPSSIISISTILWQHIHCISFIFAIMCNLAASRRREIPPVLRMSSFTFIQLAFLYFLCCFVFFFVLVFFAGAALASAH